ncbi:hypothetical protein [Brachybacterium sp. UNK5269]|uniref:hypothetical protein n=1 Tax=Brachybacterium sp. UNK5269 TaxID=3408576 RepID=UPI003BAF5566
MNTLTLVLPLLAVAIVLGALLVSLLTLWVRHQHPRRILLRTLGAASMLAIIGLLGIFPDSWWWAPWLLTAATAGGAIVACRRALVGRPPAEPTKRQAREMSAPHPLSVAGEVIIYLALLAVALLAG